MNNSDQARAVMLEHHLNCAQSLVIYVLRGIRAGPKHGIKIGDGFGAEWRARGKPARGNRRLYDPGVTQHINENNARESIERTYKLIRDFNREFTHYTAR